jgi:hypothetical protein
VVRWGPIIAGLFTAIATLLILAILGLAIGLTAFEPENTDQRTFGTAGGIWRTFSALVAFFSGGWIAGRTAGGHLASRSACSTAPWSASRRSF